MNISEDEVRYVAALANLALTDGEIARMSADMGEILTYVEKLNQLDTIGVEPMAQVLYESEETATLRPDEPHEPLGTDTALANAPASGAGHYKVPKVIER